MLLIFVRWLTLTRHSCPPPPQPYLQLYRINTTGAEEKSIGCDQVVWARNLVLIQKFTTNYRTYSKCMARMNLQPVLFRISLITRYKCLCQCCGAGTRAGAAGSRIIFLVIAGAAIYVLNFEACSPYISQIIWVGTGSWAAYLFF
jgi:hypothetical protein